MATTDKDTKTNGLNDHGIIYISGATQRKILPLDYAFSPAAFDAAITLFIDHERLLGNMLGGGDEEKMSGILMR